MATPKAVPSLVDFTLQNEGTIFLLVPHTDAGRAWVEEHIGQGNGYQPYWPTVVIEHCYMGQIAEGIVGDGLVLR